MMGVTESGEPQGGEVPAMLAPEGVGDRASWLHRSCWWLMRVL